MIIKCPECGHQVSDKAPVCPSCGVEIAGHIVRCPHCGEIHFISDGICPNCHHSLLGKDTPTEKVDETVEEPVVTPDDTVDEADEELDDEPLKDDEPDTLDEEEKTVEEAEEVDEPVKAVPIINITNNKQDKKKETKSTDSDSDGEKKKGHTALIISFIIAAIICLGLLYAYNHANQKNEAQEYKTAIASRDPSILQSYLDTYTNAPTAHRDSVLAILNSLRAGDPQWEKVKLSNNRDELQKYLQQNPNSPHKQEVINLIDELDWKSALQTHDFANYLSLHQNGIHAGEAVDSVRHTIDMPASDADKQKAVSAVRSFLVAINSHSSDKVRSTVANHLEYFNEKSSVGGDEALNYMAIIYRDAERLNWHVDNAGAAKVSKKGDGASAEYSIIMPARLSVNYNSGNNVQARYNIQAKVNGSGLITAIKLIKLADEKPKSSKSSDGKSEAKKNSNSDNKSSAKKTTDKGSSAKKK